MSDGYTQGKPDLGWWVDRIEAGKRFRKKVANEERWDIWRSYYRHDFADDVLPMNIYFKMLRTIVPRIYFRNPSISITPGKPGIEHMVFAKILERIDNKLIRKLGMKTQMKRIAQNAFMFGKGIGKVGYSTEFNPSPDELSRTTATDDSNRLLEYNSMVQENMPWFLSAHPDSVIVPAGIQNLDEARWIAHEVQRRVADVRNDPRFNKRQRMRIGPSQQESKKHSDWHARGMSDLVSLIEVRDKKTGKVFVYSPVNTEDVLLFEDDDLQHGRKFNFVDLSFNEDDQYFWSVADSKILDDIQREANETRTLIQKHRRISVAKILAKKGAIPEHEAEKLLSANVRSVINVDGDPLTDIRELQGNNVPEDLIRNMDMVIGDARETVGFSRNQMSEFRQGSEAATATEAKIVQAASEIRVDERRDMAADLMVAAMERINRIIFSLWDEEEVVQISGPQGVPLWVKFRPSMLSGSQFEIKVDPDSSLPETKEMRERKAIQLYQFLNQDSFTDQVRLRMMLANELVGPQYDGLFKIPDPMMVSGPQEPMEPGQAAQVFGKAQEQGSEENPADMRAILREVGGGG